MLIFFAIDKIMSLSIPKFIGASILGAAIGLSSTTITSQVQGHPVRPHHKYLVPNNDPHPQLTEDQLKKLVQNLGSNMFTTRNKALEQLKIFMNNCPTSHLATFFTKMNDEKVRINDEEINHRVDAAINETSEGIVNRINNEQNIEIKLNCTISLIQSNALNYKEDNHKVLFNFLLANTNRLSLNSISTMSQALPKSNLGIKLAFAEHGNTPTQALTSLAGDQEVSVRCAVAENQNTLAQALIALAGDEDSSVRYAVAQHRNTPIQILVNLTQDQDPDVREIAQKALASRR